MKKINILLALILCLTFVTCKKDIEPDMPKVTISKTDVSANNVIISGTYEYSMEVTSFEILYSDNENMTLLQSKKITPEGNTFNITIEDLNPNTTYYYYFLFSSKYNSARTEKKNFKTNKLPTVTTNDVTNITAYSASCGGNVTDDGNGTVTARGICWSTSQNPTINNSHTTDGNGTGSFTSNITGLTANTTYYVRAYAVNEKGVAYGEEKSFKTEEIDISVDVDSDGNEIVTLYGNIVFKMISVEGGTFSMGATPEQGGDADSDEKPVHSVTLSDYYIGETEVTQELWEAVMGTNPSYFKGSQKPVEKVSWNDCKEFITKLNRLTGKKFRLPTEAEWEYAARGGNKSKGYKYSGSNTIGDVAWYGANSSSTTHNVKTKSPNELGIYDMSGNVYEWCEDWYGSYSSGSQTNPTGPSSGSYRVKRGGSWYNNAKDCRVSYRAGISPSTRNYIHGFRVVCLP